MTRPSEQAVSVAQIRALDQWAIRECGIPSLSLMENAGRSVAEEAMRHLSRTRNKCFIICGLGNNAGDGLVAARHLLAHGFRPKIILIGRGRRLKQDAAVNYRILRKIRYPVKEVTDPGGITAAELRSADVVVDAIFGVGLNRSLEGLFRHVIAAINAYAKFVIAVDVPSGLDGDTGKVWGACVRADCTLTFSYLKKGLCRGEGPRCAGKVMVKDIGIPRHGRHK